MLMLSREGWKVWSYRGVRLGVCFALLNNSTSDFVFNHWSVCPLNMVAKSLPRADWSRLARSRLACSYVCSRPGRLEFRSSTPKPWLDISFRGAYLLEVVAVFCLLFVGDFGFRDVTFDVEAVTFRSRSDRDKLDTVEELKAVMLCYPLHSKGDW